jgi:SAM-dependent methyltransferase
LSQVWDERAQLYRDSEAHREGEDLDLIVEWSLGASGRRALDVATGGGHVARRLREAGFEVTSSDPAPAMGADVVCRAEELPFERDSFDVVACRVAAHHFDDVRQAVEEMARVSSDLVLLADNLNLGQAVEEAERLRDPTHVRCHTEAEWRDLFAAAGLTVEDSRVLDKPVSLEPWLERAGCQGDAAARVRALLGEHVQDGKLMLSRLVLKGRKR